MLTFVRFTPHDPQPPALPPQLPQLPPALLPQEPQLPLPQPQPPLFRLQLPQPPGVSFRGSLSGREAYLTGHRVAVWEVVAVYQETKSVDKTASHFRWPRVLVKRALTYATAFPEEVGEARDGEAEAAPAAG